MVSALGGGLQRLLDGLPRGHRRHTELVLAASSGGSDVLQAQARFRLGLGFGTGRFLLLRRLGRAGRRSGSLGRQGSQRRSLGGFGLGGVAFRIRHVQAMRINDG